MPVLFFWPIMAMHFCKHFCDGWKSLQEQLPTHEISFSAKIIPFPQKGRRP